MAIATDPKLNPGQRHADNEFDFDERERELSRGGVRSDSEEQSVSRARSMLANQEEAAGDGKAKEAADPDDKAYDSRTPAEREAAPIPYTPYSSKEDGGGKKKNRLKLWLAALGALGILGGGTSIYQSILGLPRDLIEQAAHTVKQRVSGYARSRVQPYILSFLSKHILGNKVAIKNCASDTNPVPMITKDCFYRTRGNHPNSIWGRANQAWWDGKAAKRMVEAGIDIEYHPGGGSTPPRWTMKIAGTQEFEVSVDNPEGDLQEIFGKDALNGKDAKTRGDIFKIQNMFMQRFTEVTHVSSYERMLIRRFWERQFGLSSCTHYCFGAKRALPGQSTTAQFRARLLGNIAVKVVGTNTYGLAIACMVSREYSCSEADSEFRRQREAIIQKAVAGGLDVAKVERALALGDLAKNSGQRLATVLIKDVLGRVTSRTTASILASPIPFVGTAVAVIGVAGLAMMVYNTYDSTTSETIKFLATMMKDEAFAGASNILAIAADERNGVKPIYDEDADSAIASRLYGYEKSLVWQSQYGNVAGLKDFQALFGREVHAETIGTDEYPNKCNDDGTLKRNDKELVCPNWRYDYVAPVVATAQKIGIPPGATNEAIDNVADVANDVLNTIGAPSDAATEAVINTPVGQQVSSIVNEKLAPLVTEITEQVLAPPFTNADDVKGAKLLDAAWAGMDRSHNLMVRGGLEADDTPYGYGRVLTDAEVEEQGAQARLEIAQEFASLPLLDRLLNTKYSQSFASQLAFASPTAINTPFQFIASILSPMTGMRYAAMNSPRAQAAITPYSNHFHIPQYGLGKTELAMGPALKEDDPAPCPNDRTPMSLNDPRAINRGLGQAEYPTANLCAADEYALKVFSASDSSEPIDDTPTNSATSPVSTGGGVGKATGILGWPIEEADYKYDTTCFNTDRGTYNHAGMDLVGLAGEGRTKILASDGGSVVYVEPNSPSAGGWVVIQHAEKKYTTYMHMVKIQVKQGQGVEKGQLIGYEGNTGDSKGAHLHFELGPVLDGTSSTNLNPLRYLEPFTGRYKANTSCPR